MISDLEDMANDWKMQDTFKDFGDVLSSLSETMRPMKEAMDRSFLSLMIQEVYKHNQRYLSTPKLVRAVFAEKETGQLVASMLISDNEETNEPTSKNKSVVHGCKIDLH
jgi:hypothetical protein